MAGDVQTLSNGEHADRSLAQHAVLESDAPTFSLGSLLMGMAWLCFLLALGKVWVEVAVILAILSLPALGRAAWLRGEYERRGKPITLAANGWHFLSSVAAISAAVAVGIGAFLIICAVFAGVILTLLEIFASETLFVLSTLIPLPAFCVALGTGIWTGVQIERLLRPGFLAASNTSELVGVPGYKPSTSAME